VQIRKPIIAIEISRYVNPKLSPVLASPPLADFFLRWQPFFEAATMHSITYTCNMLTDSFTLSTPSHSLGLGKGAQWLS
jgi:hypothetical protein